MKTEKPRAMTTERTHKSGKIGPLDPTDAADEVKSPAEAAQLFCQVMRNAKKSEMRWSRRKEKGKRRKEKTKDLGCSLVVVLMEARKKKRRSGVASVHLGLLDRGPTVQ